MEKSQQLNQLRQRTNEVILREWEKQFELPTLEEINEVKVLLNRVETVVSRKNYINIAS